MLIESDVETGWVKVPVSTRLIFVGRDTVCLGKGCHLMFYNLTNNQEHVYSAYNFEKGDGVQCYAGHRNLPILAFAEKLLNPRLFIITFPDFVKLKIIENGAPEGYMTMTFSEQTYLITLSDLPRFELVLWNWRTAEKLFSINTEVSIPNQSVICSIHTPISIAQYSENYSDFVLWNIHSSYKHCVGIKHELEMPNQDKILSCLWSSDDTLYILNKYGCIYQLNSDNSIEIIIYTGTSIGNEIPCFTWFRGGLIVLLTNLDIKYFKKASGTWYEEWNVTPVKLKQLVSCAAKDLLLGWSNRGEIMELDLNKQCFVVRKNFETVKEIFCLIYPTCNYFASLSPRSSSQITVWESLSGNEVGNIEVKGIITIIASNPIYPYVAAGLSSGTLTLINCYYPENLKVLTNFFLYRQEISKVVFNSNGDIIVAASLYYGLFFVIRGVPGTAMEILHFIDYRRQSLDVSVSEEEKYINLYILVQTDKCLSLSQRIVVKSISKTSNRIKKKKYISQKHKFTHLKIINNVFIAKQFNSKIVCTLQFLKKTVKVLKEIHTGHYLRHFMIDIDQDHIYTYGYDGLIIIRSNDLNTIVGALLPHHRYSGGVENVIVDPFMRYVISYGVKSNELVCSKFLIKTVDDHTIKESVKKFVDMKFMFTDASLTTGFEPNDENAEKNKSCKTFLELRQQEIIEQEKKNNAKERQAIMEDFQILKAEVVALLEQNLNGPELEKIDILEFYQHTLLRHHKEEMNRIKCEWTVKYYKELIKAQDEIWRIMKKKFYDSMESTGTLIRGMFSLFSVESYSILPGAAKFVQYANIAGMIREHEDYLREGDLFRPWENLPDLEILKKLENPPVIKIKSETARIKEALEDLDRESSVGDIKINASIYPSNTVSDFIEPSKLLYDQDEIHCYSQIIFQLKLMENDHEILRSLFNEKYNEMKQQKVRDLNVVLEKNNRLRFILSELNNTNIRIDDPRWHSSEYVENILTVKKSEIGITPYISPSEQALLDWQAAEEERIRLLLLADDFREKALIKMMDGVLEVRWEDTLKRDIPKPKCMLEKDPETFNEDDLRAIRDYEEKVAFLNSERQMYKNMLETEYTKTAEQVREIIRKFNSKLRDILLYKIRIESARMQQGFIIQRLQNKSINRMFLSEKELKTIENIKINEKRLADIQKKITELNDASIDCRNVGEIFLAKEKVLERNFKRDFQDYSALIQEQGFKLYRKQPKMSSKGINNVSLLNELATCCANQEKSLILTQECLDYLRSVDNLDQYVGVPNTIDEAMYKIICKHRRFKIENELKIKANTIEQQDIDLAIQAFQKNLTMNREFGTKLTIRLQEQRDELIEFIHDKDMQIVIKSGLVEITRNGNITDCEDAILINRQDVETINKIILKAGARKLQVMNEKMIHRRSILMKEWEHRRMKMEIEDLNEHLRLIDHVKVTKEIQQYLRQRAKGESFDKGTLTLDQEIESKKMSYEKVILERKTATDELEKQIKEYKKKNKILDQQIAEINVDVCEQQESRDFEFEEKYKQNIKNRMTAIVKRSKLVKLIQEQHNDILVLQTELELLRLKTYPTLKFKTLF